MLSFAFLGTDWSGALVTRTDETVDARFVARDALPSDLPPIHRETLDDVEAYFRSHRVVVK